MYMYEDTRVSSFLCWLDVFFERTKCFQLSTDIHYNYSLPPPLYFEWWSISPETVKNSTALRIYCHLLLFFCACELGVLH